ncbi:MULTISPECIES: sensor histidine kinase [Sphingomonas]|nr:sensor histidine kinase [Sphingomonas sp. CGMCC 1.13658]MBA2921254.1 sensor histidine kinase [Sphingomonas sp. CGMCC 1.13658]
MKGGSLRLRLLFGGAAAIAVALALAWFGMTLLFDRHIERRVAEELRAQAVPLLAGLATSNGAPVVGEEPADPRFSVPASGLYWQVGSARSRSLWDSRLPPADNPRADNWSSRTAAGPFGQQLLLVERRVQLDPGQKPLVIQLGYDLARLAPARREFGREMGLFVLLLWVVLSVAAWIQVALGLKPLSSVREELGRLRRDPSARLNGAYPSELRPLIGAIDDLADAREADLARARRRAADLAHGLKTPLAALSAQSAKARRAGANEAADGLDAAIAAVRAAVDGELARTRIGLLQSEGQATPAARLVDRLVDVIEHTQAGERIAFTTEVDDGAVLPLAGDDAAELLGPLLENAARHARRRVLVRGEARPDALVISVADDGPGLDAAHRSDAVLRGARLDSSSDGYGLGLAIARELAEATQGTMELRPGPLGGLEVRLSWLR